ncbi:MAG TPA: acyl-CoA dehydrogenase family protein [Xanthobacteraceae bacterium]|nr:acyl-CoA dehydrogenase family protein [Xanthobacteraceae bacterium]
MEAVEEQTERIRMIRDSAGAIAMPDDLKRIRALRYREPGFDRAVWRQMCELGWTALRVPEAAGGSGLGMREYCALAEECGASLLPEPLISCSFAARVLAGAELARLIAGDMIIIPAWQERANSLALHGDTTLRDGRLSGRKVFVPMALGADAFLVSTDRGLALVAADAVLLKIDRTQDGGHYGTLTFHDAPAKAVAGDLTEAIEEATLATSAYLLGVMERAFAITLTYLKTRQQFGKPIGSFQALAHRAADLKIQVALTRASVEAAAATLDTSSVTALRRAAVSRAKARASDAAMRITREAIQMHGGIGYTDEYDVGLYLRKAMVLANLFGSATLHRARYAELATEDDDE